MCDAIPVNPPVNLNFKFPIGPCRNPLKLYNYIECVKEVSVWTKHWTTVDRLHSYHKQGHRGARANKSMSSSRKKISPRKGNRANQKLYSVLKDIVKVDAPELYSIRNLLAKYDPRDFFPSKAELH